MTSPNVLSFKQGSKKWRAYRERALKDLFWFNSVILGYSDYFPLEKETHLLIHKFMERKTGQDELDKAPFQLLMWPRGTGKTTCGTRGHAIQMACANPDIAILIANERQENADAFLAEIKYQFEANDLLRHLFPEVIPDDFNKVTWKGSKAALKRKTGRVECTFETIGVGGTVTGMHYDVIICDDLISREAMENARAGSWLIMERTNRWINQLKPLLNQQAKPFPWVRFIGTNWWNGDIYDYIEETFTYDEPKRPFIMNVKLPDGRINSREAWRAGDLACLKMAAMEKGKPTFPKIYSAESLAKIRAEDPELFACNMMNNPSEASVRTFQDDWLRYWRPLDRQLICYDNDDGSKRYVNSTDLHKTCVVDPAFTAQAGSDRSAIVVVGSDPETGRHLVLEAKAQKVDSGDLVIDVLHIANRWGCQRIFIEAVGQQLGFINHVKSEALNRNARVIIDTVKPGGRNKDIRIEGLAPYFKQGLLLLHRSQLDLLDEYQRYRPGARYRDLLDALAYAPEKWLLGRYRAGTGQARARNELAAYHKRRGLQPA